VALTVTRASLLTEVGEFGSLSVTGKDGAEQPELTGNHI